MFIATADLEYGWKKKLIELFIKNPDAYQRLRALVNLVELPHTLEELEKLSEYSYGRKIIDERELEAWTEAGVCVTVDRLKGLQSNARELPQTVYQISVANVGLMQIQQVEVLEDCCTHDLQYQLDRGWRILAVCPPNDARRPTYVVGHFEKEA